jgi:pimeloyl-ACP methyl ester carboxylesterase
MTREGRWSEAIAVGNLNFVENVKSELGFKAAHREVTEGAAHVRSVNKVKPYGANFTAENDTSGGFAAYDYVLWHPERLRSLVVAASGGAIVDEELSKLREKTTLPGFRSWPPEFREVSMGYMPTNPEGLKGWLEIHDNSQQKGAPAQSQRMTITFEKLATIRVPTLLMPGDQDLQCPPWIMRRQLAHIPGVEFIILPEASHSINWEQPDPFNRTVLEFIRKH